MINLGVIKHPGLQRRWCFAGSFANLKPWGHRSTGWGGWGVQKRGPTGFSSLLLGGSLKAIHIPLQRAVLKPQTSTWHILLIQGMTGLSGGPFLLHPTATYIGVGEEKADPPELAMSWQQVPTSPRLHVCMSEQSSFSHCSVKNHDPRWNLTPDPKKQDLHGTRPTLWAEDWGGRWVKEETLRCPLSSLPKTGSQDPNFCSTLSSCDNQLRDIRLVQLKPNMPLILPLEAQALKVWR